MHRKCDAVLHTILAYSCTGRSIAHVSECMLLVSGITLRVSNIEQLLPAKTQTLLFQVPLPEENTFSKRLEQN
jgi:hypothetical protein